MRTNIWRIYIFGRGGIRKRDNIEVVQKYPKDFFRNIGDFTAPNPVRSGLVHLEDECKRPAVLLGDRIFHVIEDGSRAARKIPVSCGGEMHEQ